MPCLTNHFDPAIGLIVNLGIAKPATVKSPVGGKTPTVTLCQALVDTGADVTCVSPQIAQAVGLQVVGKRQMGSSTGICLVNTYLADILLTFGDPTAGAPSLVKDSMTLMEFQPNNPNFQALLGRDVLCGGLLSMAGWDKRFTICM